MIRIIAFLCALCLSVPKTYGQVTVYKDEKGQVFTTSDLYQAGIKETAYNKLTYLGSPFLTFPVWQDGKIQLDKKGKELNCQLAYNLVSNQVLCRFIGDSTVKIVTPEVFTINGTEFIRQQTNLLGADYRIYYTILHNGPTKLLMSLSNQIMALNSTEAVNSRYYRDLHIQGIYRTKTKYYIQKGDAQPEPVNLTKNSVLAVLNDQAEKIAPKLTAKQLTTEDIINVLTYYDALTLEAQMNKPAPTANPVFKQILRDTIAYPTQAKYQGIYGRVYAGFEVDKQGTVKNITILSPENAGFGFADEVKKFMETLPRLDSTFIGKYALPVAFTYANSKEKTGAHVPVNHLSNDRFEGRTMLAEMVVPAVVSKPVASTREVWGYYK